ncbi:DUF1853 family protein [Ulvibacter litoralis]|uniref:DUF1853 domain-containing protein n=1 Tax=Ulvibacter litoralis TaxID=227084 RepID=A0A1G7GSM8_9FLAO|nr:DUF1853 family protein [Ulvibacter litoralis]GHC55256.1 hypothetical protein GCM10008083_19200 [Ulvibacter litoralis]SDE90959.1 hypothetical protein SAMN05421855_103304 [Ulvibacter litoralis]
MYPYSSFTCVKNNVSISEDIEYPTNAMVGKQAEFCFETYLKSTENYKILTANIQIQGTSETLGELDYLVYSINNKQILHIELACKFYVHDVSYDTNEESHWIGPNRKDTLSDKLGKLKEKQFPLLFKSETKKKLATLGIETDSIVQQVCLKAFLFIPKHLQKESFPKEYSDCIIGYWIRFHEFSSESETALYAIPKKKEWLIASQNTTEWVSFSEIQNEIKLQLDQNKSPLVYKKRQNTIERFFVVWW